MADSSILDGNRWPHWGQFCGLSTPARVDLRGGPPERLEPACGCNSSARSINSYDTAGLILPWYILYRAMGLRVPVALPDISQGFHYTLSTPD